MAVPATPPAAYTILEPAAATIRQMPPLAHPPPQTSLRTDTSPTSGTPTSPSQEASLLLVLFRFCVAHFRWQVQTPRVQAALGSEELRLADRHHEVHNAMLQPPIVRLYSEPWIYYRAEHALAPGAVTSAGMLPHHELLFRFGTGRRLAPSGWVYALVRTAAPFSRAEHSLRAWLPLPHDHRPDQL